MKSSSSWGDIMECPAISYVRHRGCAQSTSLTFFGLRFRNDWLARPIIARMQRPDSALPTGHAVEHLTIDSWFFRSDSLLPDERGKRTEGKQKVANPVTTSSGRSVVWRARTSTAAANA